MGENVQVLLLMSSALNVPIRESIADGVSGGLSNELHSRQQSIAEITEMIHVCMLFLHAILIPNCLMDCQFLFDEALLPPIIGGKPSS